MCDIISDPTIVICPADKGRAIVIEDRDSYLSKMQQQLDEGDYVIDNRKEKTLLDKLHKKISNQLRSMDIDLDDFKEKSNIYTVNVHTEYCSAVHTGS